LRRLGLAALAALVIFAASAVWSVYHKEEDSRILREQAERRLAELTVQEQHLDGEIARLKTARGQEAALRQQYEVGKAGERLIVIVEPAAPEPIEASSTWQLWVDKYLPFW
jgi:hypothetical protein